MEKSDASAAWDDYFASEFGGLTDFTGLRDQLDELEDDVFDDESRVSISDIAGGKFPPCACRAAMRLWLKEAPNASVLVRQGDDRHGDERG